MQPPYTSPRTKSRSSHLCRFNSRAVALLAIAAVYSTAANAATIDLGNAGAYSVFGLGSTVGVGSADTVTGNTAEIYGSVAIGADTTNTTAVGNATLQK